MKIEVHRMGPARRDDFYKVHCTENGSGWCYCVAWWVSTWTGWDERTSKENRYLREKLFDKGEYDGYLLYINREPVGWCQVGPRDRLEKLLTQYNLKPHPEIWAITCFFISPEYRRKKLATFMLKEVLLDLKDRGVKRLEAYPKAEKVKSPDELWTGPLEIYKKLGFKVIHKDAKRPILSLEL